MKKILAITILVTILSVGSIKPASAQLVLDASQLATKISDMTQKITDQVNKVTEQINQAKQMASQGFSLNALRDMAKKYINDSISSFLSSNINRLVEGTKEKKKAVLEADVTTYLESSGMLYDKKIEDAEADKKKMEEYLTISKKEKNSKTDECEILKDEYEHTSDVAKQSEAWAKYNKCMSELKQINNDIEELDKGINHVSAVLNDLSATKAKIGTEEDKNYMQRKARVDALEASSSEGDEASEFMRVGEVSNSGGSERTQWDEPGSAEFYAISQNNYETFIKRYFYDPNNLSATATVNVQSNLDRIYRERRYLYINTAAHLLQVATSARRQIPVHTAAIDAFSNATTSEQDELNAIGAYATTRVESAKALLLYAKLLSAKLQYLAARDLLQAQASKEFMKNDSEFKDFEDFNLSKYLLTEGYISNLLHEFNTPIPTDVTPSTKIRGGNYD